MKFRTKKNQLLFVTSFLLLNCSLTNQNSTTVKVKNNSAMNGQLPDPENNAEVSPETTSPAAEKILSQVRKEATTENSFAMSQQTQSNKFWSSFETDWSSANRFNTCWTPGAYTEREGWEAHDGKYKVRLQNQTFAPGAWCGAYLETPAYPVIPGEKYAGGGADRIGGARVELALNFYDDAMNIIYSENKILPNDSWSWKDDSIDGIAPARAKYVRLRYGNFSSQTGVDVDTVWLRGNFATDRFEVGIQYVTPSDSSHWDWITYYESDPSLKQKFLADVNVMASLGVKYAALTIDPGGNGMRWGTDYYNGENCRGMVILDAELETFKTNLKSVIKVFKQHGIMVVPRFMTNQLAFGSSYGWDCAKNTNRWQQNWGGAICPGGDERAKADLMGRQIAAWENAIVGAIEADTEAGSNVAWWGLLAEHQYLSGSTTCPWSSDVGWHMAWHVLSGVSVPSGKLAADAGTNVQWAANLQKTASDLGKTISLSGFSSYPNQNDSNGSNQNITQAMSAVQSAIPSANVVVQEAGSHFCQSSDEQKQIHTATNGGLKDIIDQAAAWRKQNSSVLFSGVFLWSLWDYQSTHNCPNGCHDSVGWSIHDPRDVYGYMASRQPPFNGDFEQNADGWVAAGNDANFQWLGRVCSGQTNTATGLCNARMNTSSKATHWVCSPVVSVSGNSVVPGGYIRQSLTNGEFKVGLSYHTATGWKWTEKTKNWNNAGWVWRNLQAISDAAGGPPKEFDFGPLEPMDLAVLCVLSNSDSAETRSLDLDAISIGSYWK